MRMKKLKFRLTPVLGALAGLLVGGAVVSARGQIGGGWTQMTYGERLEPETNDVLFSISPPPSVFIISPGDYCTYTNSGGVETFNLWNPDSNRIEIRVNDDYTSGNQQFEGDVRLSPPTDNECVMQIFGSDGNGNATLFMLRGFSANGGSLEHYGDTVVVTNIYNTWVHVNIIHVPGQYVQTYINGVLAGQWTRGSNSTASHYFKYGCYGTLNTASAGVQWKNVKFFTSGLPPTAAVWNATNNISANTNWSTGANWLPAALGAGDDVKFYDNGSVAAASNINNVVDADFGIASLQYGNTNGNHTTLIASGNALDISGTNGLGVGTETDNGTAQTVDATLTGTAGTLEISNSEANLTVRQGTANSGGSQRATLDMSGLGNFVAALNQILVGADGLVNRATGTLYLAETNLITASGSPGILVGDNHSNNGGPNFVYLGWTNAIFADGITIARQKSAATFAINPGFPNAFAYFRAADGSSRIANWDIADNSLQSSSSSSARGTNDFSNGTVDALVDTLVVGKSQTTTGADSIGVLTFTSGIFDVNTLQIGFQSASGATSAGIGMVNVYGANAMLRVNSVLELGHTSGGAGTANTFGTLSVNGGTVLANTIAAGAGSGANTVTLDNGTLVLSNTMGTPMSGIRAVQLTNSTLGLRVDGNSAVTNVTAVNLAAGGVNQIQINSVANVTAPITFHLVSYATFDGSETNFALTALPAGYSGALINNSGNHTLDLVLALSAAVIPRITACALPGMNFVLSGTNGLPQGNYYVLTSTNLALPLNQWLRLATNAFDDHGNFNFTFPAAAGAPQQFYLIEGR